MTDSYKELFQKKKIIRFKVLMHILHYGDKTKFNKIAEEVESNKSEITKCVNTLVEEGLLKKVGYRSIQLTTRGMQLADEYHRKYQIALVSLQRYFDDDTAKSYAESLAMLFESDEIGKIFDAGFSMKKITQKMTNHQNLDGAEFCKLMESGSFTIPFTIDPVFNPKSTNRASGIHSVSEELADFWHERSKEMASERKSNPENETVPDQPTSKRTMFVEFLNEIIKKAQSIYFERYLQFRESKYVSMANRAFLHPGFCQITDSHGTIKLHRVVITEQGMRNTTLTCKAEIVRYYDGKEFVDCPFVDDDVSIPMDHIRFTRYGDTMIGKLLLQFKAECDVIDMPISIAELVLIFYPI